MHSAPSVSYPAGRSRFAAALLLVAWLLGCATAAAWWQGSPDGWRPLAMFAALAAAGLFAAWSWWCAAQGTLGWDGEAWGWSMDGTAGTAQVAELEIGLDLQHCMLLRCTAGNASRWLWLERASDPARWDDVRRAVYSRARPKALQPAEPPAAKP